MMKSNNHVLLSLFISSTLCLNGCGGGSGSSTTSGGGSSLSNSSNSRPVLNSAKTYSFEENANVEISLNVSHSNKDELTYIIRQEDDWRYFSIDEKSGVIKGEPFAEYFDFEDPRDTNKDNVYVVPITISDGKNTLNEKISITITDLNGPLTCSSGDLLEIEENTGGIIYTFEAAKPDTPPAAIFFDPELTITAASGKPVPPEIISSIGTSGTGTYFKKERHLRIMEFINAENLETLDDIYTVSFTSEIDGEAAMCDVSLRVQDVENEVVSGIKFSGGRPDDINLSHTDIGDIDGDGLSEIWVRSSKPIDDITWDHRGYLIFGKALDKELSQDGAEEIMLANLPQSHGIKFEGSYPPINPLGTHGVDLIPSPIGDIDGDGISEFLLGLATPSFARSSAFADRPMAYLIWGDGLLGNMEGLVDLNNLQPFQGLPLEGLGGIDRRSNSVQSGDFDADGIDDVIIRVPNGAILSSDGSLYQNFTFIVFGDYLKTMKGEASLDLLEDIESINPNHIVVTATDSRTPNTPQTDGPRGGFFGGTHFLVVPDIDGDGTSEIANSGGQISQHRQLLNVVSGRIIREAKGNTGLVLSSDLEDGDVDNFVIGTDGHWNKGTGDFDGDGINDLIASTYDFPTRRQFAHFLFGKVIRENMTSEPIDFNETEADNLIVRVETTNTLERAFRVDIIRDIDGDGRDDFAFTNSPTDVVILLSKSLDNTPAGEIYSLEDMISGEGLVLKIPLLKQARSVPRSSVSSTPDVDGDKIPELMINGSRKDIFLIPGKDLRAALNNGSVEFDISAQFRAHD